MSNGSDDAGTIKERGWRQGSVLPPSLFQALHETTGLSFEPDVHCVIVVSQDCDVVHPKYSTEPFVEIVRAVRRKKLDGNLVYAKSARKLQLEIATADAIYPYELSIHDRRMIDRRLLETSEPDSTCTLSDGQKRQLAGWLAKRYRRDAFPDEFVNRLNAKSQADALRKLFKEWGQWVSGLYILLDHDADLPSETPYVVTAWATVPAASYADDDVREGLDDKFQPALEEALNACQGIQVADAMVVSEEDFTLDDVRNTRKMDLDDLSYRDDGPMTGAD